MLKMGLTAIAVELLTRVYILSGRLIMVFLGKCASLLVYSS
jgi:hypothetical protein